MSTQQQAPPQAQMMQMVTGFWTSCCIYTAAKLNIADLLDSKPQKAETLAEATHSDGPSLYRVLRALASVSIFSENENGEFENTVLSQTLRSNVPGSMKAMAIAQLGDHFNAWGNLLYSIKTGNISFDKVEGMPVWEYYETHPEEGLNFMKAMTGSTNAAIVNVIPAYDFSQFKTIVDVGGGNGAFLLAVLDAAKQAKGIVFDEEYVIEETEKALQEKGAVRCSTEGGNFFESVPAGADTYIMKHILHDWSDEKSIQILNSCSKAMKPGSKLLVIESVIPQGNTPHPGKFMDINMMAMTGGKERTELEFTNLFAKAGLKLKRVINTGAPTLSIVEVTKD
ncbi:MAG: methyltransferase [Bacteroidota bacterium]|nr:methyltransferase [Bacteroidota bacterium]